MYIPNLKRIEWLLSKIMDWNPGHLQGCTDPQMDWCSPLLCPFLISLAGTIKTCDLLNSIHCVLLSNICFTVPDYIHSISLAFSTIARNVLRHESAFCLQTVCKPDSVLSNITWLIVYAKSSLRSAVVNAQIYKILYRNRLRYDKIWLYNYACEINSILYSCFKSGKIIREMI